MSGATETYQCKGCGKPFTARTADRARGWARFCSKSCKATKQEARTGQHAAYGEWRERQDDDAPTFSNAHLFSNEEHDCNKD